MISPSTGWRQRAWLIAAVVGVLPLACAMLEHRSAQEPGPIAGHASHHQSSPATIPQEFLDLVTTKKAFANLATVMPNGSPQVTPVWFDFDGKYIRVNSARGRVKDKNMRRDPRVALSILDPDNSYRYLSIRGRVIKITETGAVEHINALAKKYRGMDIYRSPRPDEVRVIYVIEPRRVAGQS